MGHPSPSHQWDVHKLSLFLPTPPWAREDSTSPRVLHRPLLLIGVHVIVFLGICNKKCKVPILRKYTLVK